jgi:hypothetical protein
MNAYKLNGHAGHYFRSAVCKSLNIPWTDIYKTVKSVTTGIHTNDPTIVETKDGKKYELILKEIKDDTIR